MVPRRQGLIVNITSIGGQGYYINVPYGVGKAAVDRMSADCAIEFKEHNVLALSLLLGTVKTELGTKYLTRNVAKPEKTSWNDTTRNEVPKFVLNYFIVFLSV